MTHISTSAHKDNLIYEKGIYHRKRGAMCAITYAYMQIYIYIRCNRHLCTRTYNKGTITGKQERKTHIHLYTCIYKS